MFSKAMLGIGPILPRTRMFSLAVAFLTLSVATPGSARDFEVWLVDQSDSFGKTYGGTVHIFAGSDLNGADASSTKPTDVLDLGAATAAHCLAQTGANPVRPHMLSFNANHSHAILTFVARGHVVIYDAATRTPVGCVRTSVGAGGQRQAHAAQPTPDDSYILVANQKGKRVDRITTDYATNTFVLDASLDLANGVTPNGVPMEFSGRPDNAPIIVVPDATSSLRHVARWWFIRGRPDHHADGNRGRVRQDDGPRQWLRRRRSEWRHVHQLRSGW
jgi:hypothetical protein